MRSLPTRDEILSWPKEIVGTCWLFLGAKNREGYGQKKYMGKQMGIHRIVAHVFHGLDLNDSSQLACHKNSCISKSCFNPDCIYVGDRGTNLLDAYAKGTIVSPWKGRKYNSHTGMK